MINAVTCTEKQILQFYSSRSSCGHLVDERLMKDAWGKTGQNPTGLIHMLPVHSLWSASLCVLVRYN